MKEREPERNESTDEAVWLDLVSRLQNMPADETHGGRDALASPRTGITDAPEDQPEGQDGREVFGTPDSSAGASVPPGVNGSPASGQGGSTAQGGDERSRGTPATGSNDSVHRSAAERTRAIFENQPFRSMPPRGPRDYDEPEDLESEGEFVPPEPPPFSTGEPLVVLAWTGALGGPVLLLLFAMFWRSAPLAVILGVIALFVAAAGYLLFRLPSHHDDDGAAV